MHLCECETGDLSGDGSLQRLSVDRVLRLNGDVQFLACIFPRDREHTYVFHAEFLLKRLLDRFGRNFVAEDVDHIREAAAQSETDALVKTAKIAGIKIAVAEEATRGFFIVDIAGHAIDSNPHCSQLPRG